MEFWLENERRPFSSPWALISIWGDNELLTLPVIEKLKSIGCEHALSSKFSDVTAENMFKYKMYYGNATLFDEVQAHHIIKFLESNKDSIDTLVVHCAAGVSRSGAVGLFSCRYLNLDEKEFRNTNKMIHPNYYVLSVLNRVSKIKDDYVKIWEEELNKEKVDGSLIF